MPFGEESCRGQFFTGAAIEDREELRAGEWTTGGVAVVRGVIHYGRILANELGGVGNEVSESVSCPGGGLGDEFGAAISIQIVDKELDVVRACAEVDAQMNPPEQRAVELVGVEDIRSRESIL